MLAHLHVGDRLAPFSILGLTEQKASIWKVFFLLFLVRIGDVVMMYNC